MKATRFHVPGQPTSVDSALARIEGAQNRLRSDPVVVLESVLKPFRGVWKLADAVRIMGEIQLGKRLSGQQVDDIVAFLGNLTGRIPADALRLPVLPPAGPDTPRPRPKAT